ncbi:MAG: 4Fe-4S binding protein [Candidatus Zixiibacteriota bacterium]|nr:MAG: 4Fe-4S binding protein [candidate division Zixibacteria bacterium]
MKVRYVRYSVLVIILALVLYLAFGYGTRSFEAYCPFGGAESLWGLFTTGEFTCALSPLNLSMLLALLVLALVSKKAFCGWACPIGFFGELLGRAGCAVTGRRLHPSQRLNGALKLLRYIVLVLFLVLTYKTGELVLRGYDPYYLIFSGVGHGTAGVVSYIVLVGLGIGALIVPMFFCRYFCPMGAVFDPFSRLGLIKITRDGEKCTECGNCQTACPHSIPVQSFSRVRHRDCTNCFECVDACPEGDVLTVRASI